MLLKNSDNGNPAQFKVTAASMPDFLGTIVNFYWQGSDAFSWISCYPQANDTYAYEIHGLYKLGSTFTGEMINSMQDTYMKEKLNPQNLSLKLSPHPTSACAKKTRHRIG